MKILVGDGRSVLIGDLDFDTKTEYGNKVERFFTTRPFSASGDTIFSRELELDMQAGV